MAVYRSSCAGAFGMALQEPLISWGEGVFKACALSGDLSSIALAVMKIVLRLLVTPLVVFVLILPWAVGQLICRIARPAINYETMRLVPETSDLLPDESEDDPSLQLVFLADEFEQLPFPENMNPRDYISLKISLRAMLRSLDDEESWLCPGNAEKRKRFCGEVALYLRLIIKKMQEGILTVDCKATLLRDIAEMSTRCYPTWLEQAARLYTEVCGKKGIASNQILSYVQDYKEALLLGLCQTGGNSWHELNRVRLSDGAELGLNAGTAEYDEDGGIGELESTQRRDFLKWVFLQRYQNVTNLVNAVCTMINRDSYSAAIYELLLQIVTDSNRYENPVEYVAERYYTADFCEIRPEGVEILLRHLRVIK